MHRSARRFAVKTNGGSLYARGEDEVCAADVALLLRGPDPLVEARARDWAASYGVGCSPRPGMEGCRRLFAGIRAPSAVSTCLRSFTHGHVQQLDKVSSRLLTSLVGRVPV